MASDGSITFSTALDNEQLEKGLKQAEKDVDDLKRKLEKSESGKNAIADKLEEARGEIAETEAEIRKLGERLMELDKMAKTDPVGASARAEAVTEEFVRQAKLYDRQLQKAESLEGKWKDLDAQAKRYTSDLQAASQRQAELGAAYARTMQSGNLAAAGTGNAWAETGRTIRDRISSAASQARDSLARAAEGAVHPWENFGKRVNTMLKKVFVFGVILHGLRAIKGEISSMLQGNSQLTASVENLKSVLRGFLSTFVAAITPALISVANTLAALFEKIAGFIDSVFGTRILAAIQEQRDAASAQIQQANAEKMAEYQNAVAKAEQRQAAAAKKLAKEQEKANRQLMSFDELNTMSEESSEDAAEAVEDYAEAVAVPELETDWTQSIAQEAVELGGIFGLFSDILNRIANDTEGPFAQIREGMRSIVEGWNMVCEGLATGDWGMVWEGIKMIAIGALEVLDGSFAALMDYLNELTGYQYSDIFEGLKLAFHGAVQMIEGIINGDLGQVLSGFFDLVDGIGQAASGLIKGVFEGIKGFVDDLAGEAARRWNELFDVLEERFPQFKEAIEVMRNVVMGVGDFLYGFIMGIIDAISTFLLGAIEGAVQVIEGSAKLIVGILTGDPEMVREGAIMMMNGIITVFESAINGLIAGAIDLLNGIIRGVNHIPGLNFSEIEPPRIGLPRLAAGAVIPPNREFMAVLGDQSSGFNIEAPEGLIRQIVREESGGGAEMLSVLYMMLDAIRDGSTIYVDKQVLGRVAGQEIASMARMSGV